MIITPCVYLLKGKVQHYSWGGFEFIPDLLHISNTNHQPFAEYWLGAHPSQPAVVEVDGQNKDLIQFINENRREILGDRVEEQFHSLPYLLKILDVRQMLSIQVHPDKASAQKAFEEENKAGVPLTAFNRNYKDDSHKPELMVAFSDFWLLHGFKPVEQLQQVLSSIPDFAFLLQIFEQEGYEGLYRKVMTLEQGKVNEVLKPLVDRLLPLYRNGELTKDQEDFWVARAAETFCKEDNYDRGIFSIYFFNLIQLKRNEGIYQPTGIPHAYLEGQSVEVMANSDNVLRAGLTDKYIDINELMKHVCFKAAVPDVLSFEQRQMENVYKSPAAEFELSSFHIRAGEHQTFITTGPEILLVLSGEVTIETNTNKILLQKGKAAFIISGSNVLINAVSESILFKVAVPVSGKN